MAKKVNGWSGREKRPRLFCSRPIESEGVGVLTLNEAYDVSL